MRRLLLALGLVLGCLVGPVRAGPITVNLATGLDASNNLITTGGGARCQLDRARQSRLGRYAE